MLKPCPEKAKIRRMCRKYGLNAEAVPGKDQNPSNVMENLANGQ